MGIDIRGLRELEADLANAGPVMREDAQTVVEKNGHDVVADAQFSAPVDTGNLKASIGVDYDGDGLGYEAGPSASYGADVEFGTVPHIIKPKTAKALSWPGAAHPVASVHHPGTAPNPYMIPAFERQVPGAIEALEDAAARPLEGR